MSKSANKLRSTEAKLEQVTQQLNQVMSPGVSKAERGDARQAGDGAGIYIFIDTSLVHGIRQGTEPRRSGRRRRWQ